MFKMVKKMQNSGLEIIAGLTRPLMSPVLSKKKKKKKRTVYFFRIQRYTFLESK